MWKAHGGLLVFFEDATDSKNNTRGTLDFSHMIRSWLVVVPQEKKHASGGQLWEFTKSQDAGFSVHPENPASTILFSQGLHKWNIYRTYHYYIFPLHF